YLVAREELLNNLLKVMADNKLHAILHKAVEHQPTLISEGINPPYVNQKEVPHLNTFLVFVPSIVVPAVIRGTPFSRHPPYEDFESSCRSGTMCPYRSLLVSIQALNGDLSRSILPDSTSGKTIANTKKSCCSSTQPVRPKNILGKRERRATVKKALNRISHAT